MKLFVYGTLLRGLERNSVLDAAEYLGLARIQGSLYDLGSYPGLVEGDNFVIGELYEIGWLILNKLDQIEGFDPNYPVQSLYQRKIKKITLLADGTSINAVLYYFNTSIKKYPLINYGDYRRYRLEKKQESQWLIAYGSNLYTKRLSKRVGNVKQIMIGTIPDFKIVFNKKARKGPNSYANITHAVGSNCPAVAYYLSSEQIKILDEYEGVPDNYLRIGLPFITNQNEIMLAQCYVAKPEVLVANVDPAETYLKWIQQHNLGKLV